MMVSQSVVLVRQHEVLDASFDSSRQELSQNQKKHLQQSMDLNYVCNPAKMFHQYYGPVISTVPQSHTSH